MFYMERFIAHIVLLVYYFLQSVKETDSMNKVCIKHSIPHKDIA